MNIFTASSGQSAYITQLFKNDPDKVMIIRKNSTESTASYGVVMGYGNKAINCNIGVINAAPGSAAPEIDNYELLRIIGGQHASDATRSGTWTQTTGYSGYKGSYYASTVTGAYIQFTTAATTRIGIYDLNGVTSKLCKVELNGDATLATSLPTAQDMVTAGTLSSTALVANGGILNPTDRILNQQTPTTTVTADTIYGASRRVLLATGLAEAVYTVKITNTGYAQVGSAGTTVRFAGCWFYDDTLTMADITGNEMFEPLDEDLTIAALVSDHNFAFSYIPTGGNLAEWIGHSNTQFMNSASIYLDDVLITTVPVGNYTTIGDKVNFNISAYCRHSQSVSNVAEYVQRYTFISATGVTIEYDFDWLVAGTVSSGYIPQLAVVQDLNRAAVYEGVVDYTLNSNNDTTYHNAFGSAAYMWNPTYDWAILCCVPAYKNNPIGIIELQDRGGGTMNKIYFKNYSSSTINVNDNITQTVNYRFKQFVDAEASLAK